MIWGEQESRPEHGCVWQDVSVAFSVDRVRCATSPEEVFVRLK